MAFEFQNLEIYKKAKVFHLDCRELIARNKLDNYVRDQLGRASFSIVLNIAEGSGKFSKPDRRSFYTVARASAFECVAAIDVLHDLKLIGDVEYSVFLGKADEVSRILYRMIENLR